MPAAQAQPERYGRNQNNDLQGKLERVKGIEPSYAAWEAAVLPLNYTRRPVLYTAQAWQMQSPL